MENAKTVARPAGESTPDAHQLDAGEWEPAEETTRELGIERGPNWLFVHLPRCPAGARESASLAQRVMAALDQHRVNRVVLELDEAALPCVRLIEELQTLDHWVQEHHGVLRLCGLPPRYVRRWRHAHFTDRFPLYHDREEAVWGGARHDRPR